MPLASSASGRSTREAAGSARLYGADFIRVAACLTVLVHHLAQRMSWRGDFGLLEPLQVFAQVGPLVVAMFFVLSGFLLSRPFWAALDGGDPLPSLRTYAIRRAARILPGFWLALLVSFVLSFAIFGRQLNAELIARFVAGFLLLADWHWITFFPVEINGPLWSISFEVTAYVLLPLAFAALFPLRRWLGVGWPARVAWMGVLATVVGAHLLFMRLYPIDNYQRGWEYGMTGGAKSWMPGFNPFAFFAMFAIGALGGGVQLLLSGHRHWSFDLGALIAAAVVIYLFWKEQFAVDANGFGWLGIPYSFPWFMIGVGAVLALLPSSAVLGPALSVTPVRYLARISFGIYVWHYVVLELAGKYLPLPGLSSGQADPTVFAIALVLVPALSIAVAHMSFALIEQPAISWSQPARPGRAAPTTLSPAAS